MRITLVCMPWHALDRPSLALGIIGRLAREHPARHDVSEVHATLLWAEHLREASGGAISPLDYYRIADIGVFLGMGDWIFSSALYGTDGWKVDEYTPYLAERHIDARVPAEMQRFAPAFVENLADRIVAGEPDLVGFTTTFMQNIPSLAVARAIKARRPEALTVFGGGNCDGVMGEALHRNFPFLDYVVRGEGEQTFRNLLDVLDDAPRPAPTDGTPSIPSSALAAIDGLSWRTPDGRSVSNRDRTVPSPVAEIPEPEFDGYFRALAGSSLRDVVAPAIVLEAARGCWWGAKHQCTFCGLNGSLMAFRAKSPDRVFREIENAIARYRSLDIIMVDNIIDMRYFKSLLPRLAACDWDLRIHYEVKSNLTWEQVQLLKAARVWHIQPGIESLSSRVLELMRKGVTGVQNVQLLRDGEEHDLTISWNYLYGFPGEEERDYAHIVEQLPALVHLQPPQSVAPIALERFSPHFDDPDFGFTPRRPADFYALAYDLPEEELADLAYIFGTVEQGVHSEIIGRMEAEVERWRTLYPTSSLTYYHDGGILTIRDRRANRPAADYRFDDPVQVAIYLALRRRLSLQAVMQRLREEGMPLPEEALAAFLRELRRLGLVFEDAGSFVALAIPATPGIAAPARTAPSPVPERVPAGAPAPAVARRDLAGSPASGDRLPAHIALAGDLAAPWPDDSHLATLHRQGVMAITVEGDLLLGEDDPLGTLHFLRWLRDTAAYRLEVRWHGWLGKGLSATDVAHLPPPVGGTAAWNPALVAWRRTYREGRFAWRQGPAFALVDRRTGGPEQTLLDDGLLDVFLRLQQPAPLAAFVSDAAVAALHTLNERRLVVQLGGYSLALPYRLRHEPIAVRHHTKRDAIIGTWGWDDAA